MAVATEEDVRGIITKERAAKIYRAHAKAWKDWWDNPLRLEYSHWPRTRACMIFERLRARLIEEFSDDHGARFHFQDETFKLILDDKLLIRFKKADDKGLGANVRTQAVFNFCEAQSDIPGLPGVMKVEIVHTLNITQSALGNVIVQARDGKMKLWAYNIDAMDVSAQVFQLPTRSTVAPAAIEDLVNPRKSERKEESEDEKE